MVNTTQLIESRDIQRISVQILKRVADICDKEGLRYVLCYGTLIGAVRHRGFIPWDDDIDIAMPRPDYEKLLKYFDTRKKELLPLAVFNFSTCHFYKYGITRICNTNYEIKTKNEKNCGMGLFIDIYPIDGLGDEYGFSKVILDKNKCFIEKMCLSIKTHIDLDWKGSIKQKLKYVAKWYYYHLVGSRHLFHRIENEMKGLPDFDHSQYVACAVWFFHPLEKVIWKRSYLTDRFKMQFEQYEFYIPKEYDELLRLIYGDYMQMPPIEERIPHHHYIAWKKEKQVL